MDPVGNLADIKSGLYSSFKKKKESPTNNIPIFLHNQPNKINYPNPQITLSHCDYRLSASPDPELTELLIIYQMV
ncbi:unnamed protein product [Caretta caretta]